jgi:hypothetical protein
MRPGRSPHNGRRAAAAALLVPFSLSLPFPLVAQVAVSMASRAPAATATRSLVLPGWGQWHLGQRRAWAYGLLEAGLWATRLELQASGRHFRDQFRDVAWTAGRIQSGKRVEGPWAYYEAMSKWTRSGAYDADPNQAGVQPEGDPSTFNGAKWALAREIYFPPGVTPAQGDPAYQQALAYYEQQAYGTAYLWDWTGKSAALGEYRHLINRSDARFREASATLGAVLANHLLSAVDAYVSARAGLRPGLRVAPEATPVGLRWTLSGRVTRSR